MEAMSEVLVHLSLCPCGCEDPLLEQHQKVPLGALKNVGVQFFPLGPCIYIYIYMHTRVHMHAYGGKAGNRTFANMLVSELEPLSVILSLLKTRERTGFGFRAGS